MDSALTVAGTYTFAVADGTYQLLLRTGPLRHASSREITITSSTVFLRIEPFPMSSVGSLSGSPNPFATTLATRFALASPTTAGMGIFSLANLRLRTLVADNSFPAGTHEVRWDGQDDANQAVADGAYWVVFSGGGQNWAELVFKGP